MSRVRFTNGYSDPETRRVAHGPDHSWPDTPLPKNPYIEPKPEPINGETVALLKVYRKYNPELAAKLLAHLSEWGLEAERKDWAKLKADRVVRPGPGWELGPSGLFTAQRVARELAQKVGIKHGFYRESITPGSSAKVHCLCGMVGEGWGTKNGERSAWHQFNRHLEKISEFGDGGTPHPPSSLVHGRAVVAGTDVVRQ